MNGVIIIDKPAGFTSHDVVNACAAFLVTLVGHSARSSSAPSSAYCPRQSTGWRSSTPIREDYEGNPLRLRHRYLRLHASPPRPAKCAVGCRRRARSRGDFHGTIEQILRPFLQEVAGVPAYNWPAKNSRRAQAVTIEIKEFEILEVAADQATSAPASLRTYIRSWPTRWPETGLRSASGQPARTPCRVHHRDAHTLAAVEAARQQGIAESLLIHPESWCRSCLPSPPPKKRASSAAAAPLIFQNVSRSPGQGFSDRPT